MWTEGCQIQNSLRRLRCLWAEHRSQKSTGVSWGGQCLVLDKQNLSQNNLGHCYLK